MKRSLLSWSVAALLAAPPVAAHHAPVMFDRSTKVSLVGTVIEFAWTNPHASIQLDVPNANGVVERWGVELGSPNSMVRTGWKSTVLKAGDHVTVVINPLRSGEKGGAFVSVTLADGRVLGGRQTD